MKTMNSLVNDEYFTNNYLMCVIIPLVQDVYLLTVMVTWCHFRISMHHLIRVFVEGESFQPLLERISPLIDFTIMKRCTLSLRLEKYRKTLKKA